MKVTVCFLSLTQFFVCFAVVFLYHSILSIKESESVYDLTWLFIFQIEREEDRWFKSIVVVGDKKYSSTEW